MVLDPRQYYGAFDKYGAAYGIPHGTPREFFKALVFSGPGDPTGRGGLMQITDRVRKNFNAQTGKEYSRRVVQNEPDKSIEISAWLLGRIIRYYQEIFPSMGVDWSTPQFVGLVSLGYLAGHSGPPRSRGRGTGYAISKMLDKGIPPTSITAPTIAQAGPVIKAAKYLYDPGIQARVARIVEDMTTRRLPKPGPFPVSPAAFVPPSRPMHDASLGWVPIVTGSILLTILIARMRKK